jgi:hypothetical protein
MIAEDFLDVPELPGGFRGDVICVVVNDEARTSSHKPSGHDPAQSTDNVVTSHLSPSIRLHSLINNGEKYHIIMNILVSSRDQSCMRGGQIA